MNSDEEVALAIELLDSGVPQSRVRYLFEDRIHPSVLEDIVEHKNTQKSSRNDDVDPNIRRLVSEMKPPDEYLDPLYETLMRDPVALSSGHIFDRSSVIDKTGKLKFRICPLSSKILDDSVITLVQKTMEIERFKATRDRNVAEIARKMIASGDYDSFHLVLEQVEDYIKSLGQNYLPLTRELAAMWSGIREASCLMMIAETVNSQSYSNGQQTIVSTGGLQEKIFRIIVSVQHFRDLSFRHENISGLYLSLFNDVDQLVERCKLFEGNAKYHQIFGKHDRIVTKSRPGFLYRLECMSSGSSRSVDAQGIMCKLFPESSKRPSYRMEDAEGQQGVYMGSIDLHSRANGKGLLDYDDGRRFIGNFHRGSMTDGVLYRGAHVLRTMHGGEWDDRVSEALVEEHRVNMLVYDSSESLSGMKYDSHNPYHKGNNYRRRDEMSISVHSEHESYQRRRAERSVQGREAGDASVLDAYAKRNLPAFQGNSKYIEDIDVTSHRSNTRSTSGFGGHFDATDDLLDNARSHRNHSKHSSAEYMRDSYSSYAKERDFRARSRSADSVGSRTNMNKKFINSKDDFNGTEDLLDEGRSYRNHSQRPSTKYMRAQNSDYDKERDFRMRSRSVDLHDSRARLNDIELPDVSSTPSYDAPLSTVKLDFPRTKEISKHDNPVATHRPKSNHEDFVSVLSDDWKSGNKNNAREFPKAFDRASGTVRNKSREISGDRDAPFGLQEEFVDDNMSFLKELNISDGRIGNLVEDEEERRDNLNSKRSQGSLNKSTARPMVLMVEGYVKDVRGPSNATLMKGASLQDSVKCIFVTAEKFSDIEGMARVFLTLRDSSKKIVEEVDLFGKTTGSNYAPHRLIGDNEPIVFKAKPGYFYELECKVQSGHQDTLTLAGMICKIIPSKRFSPPFEMNDAKGWYMGRVDSNGKPSGLGEVHFHSGITFVGEFKKGKWIQGACYRGIVATGTMKNGNWDKETDKSLVRQFRCNVHFVHSRLQKPTKKSLMVKEADANSYDNYCNCWKPV